MNFPSLTKVYHNSAPPNLAPDLPWLSAAGKNVVITGGGTNIGASAALHFAKAGAASVCIMGRRDSPLQKTKKSIEEAVPGANVRTYIVDISCKDSVQDAFDTLHNDVGDIHVFICNAAVAPEVKPFKEAEVADWWTAFEINLKGSFLSTQAFLRRKAANAVVIYVSSASVHLRYYPAEISSYIISKIATDKFFEYLHFQHQEIPVYILHPGVVHEEDDISLPGAFMLWLATPEATFLRGKYIFANWDVHELVARADELRTSDLLIPKLGGWPFGDVPWEAPPHYKAAIDDNSIGAIKA